VNSDFELHADPLFGINTFYTNNKSTNILSSGFELWGAIGKIKIGATKFIIEIIRKG